MRIEERPDIIEQIEPCLIRPTVLQIRRITADFTRKRRRVRPGRGGVFLDKAAVILNDFGVAVDQLEVRHRFVPTPLRSRFCP
jgi:hypothetical protein